MKRLCLQTMVVLGLLIIVLTTIRATDTLNKAEADLNSALQANNATKIKEAVSQIAEINNEKAIKVLMNQLSNNRISSDKYDTYWNLLNGLASFTDEKALEELGNFIVNNKTKTFSRDILFVLKSNQSPGMVKLLSRILEKCGRDYQVLALDHLSEIRSKKAVEALIDFLKQPVCKRDEDLRKHTIDSLHALVGTAPGHTLESITQWWSAHQNDAETTLFPETTRPAATTGTAVDNMDYVRMNIYDRLRRLPKDKIIVVSSDCQGCGKPGRLPLPEGSHDFDHIEQILERMRIPHTVVKKSEFDTEAYKIDDKVAVLFNCNMIRQHCTGATCRATQQTGGLRLLRCGGPGPHYPVTNILSDAGVEKVKNFVAKGGYLFSEDWILEEVLEKAFRGTVSHTRYFPNDTNVTIFPASGVTTHPYLKGVFERPVTQNAPSTSTGTTAVQRRELRVGQGKWKIDRDSPDIKIDKPNDITVLMVSSDIKANDKDIGAVALTFAYGPTGIIPPAATPTGGTSSGDAGYIKTKTGGQVMHVLSHFGKQLDTSDEFVLQNLLLNFLLESAERYYLKTKK